MNDEYNNSKIETKAADSSSGSYAPPADSIPANEVPEQELYHAKSFWTRWVFSQDAKVIGVQYALTATAIGFIGLILSWGMRLQLGFPETFSFLGPATYYQSVTMHGMIMVIYLLTALFLGGFGNYLIPLMVGARDMVFPYVNMVSYWMFLVAVLVLISSFFVPGGPTGAGWTLYPPQAILPGTPGSEYGIVLMLSFIITFCNWFYNGWFKLCDYNFTSANSWHDFNAYASYSLGNFYSYCSCSTCFSSTSCSLYNDDIR